MSDDDYNPYLPDGPGSRMDIKDGPGLADFLPDGSGGYKATAGAPLVSPNPLNSTMRSEPSSRHAGSSSRSRSHRGPYGR